MGLIIWLIIGGACAAALNSFLNNRGSSSLGFPLAVVIGLIGGFLGGFLCIQFGMSVFGDGLVQLVSFAAAAVVAIIGVVLARTILK